MHEKVWFKIDQEYTTFSSDSLSKLNLFEPHIAFTYPEMYLN